MRRQALPPLAKRKASSRSCARAAVFLRSSIRSFCAAESLVWQALQSMAKWERGFRSSAGMTAAPAAACWFCCDAEGAGVLAWALLADEALAILVVGAFVALAGVTEVFCEDVWSA